MAAHICNYFCKEGIHAQMMLASSRDYTGYNDPKLFYELSEHCRKFTVWKLIKIHSVSEYSQEQIRQVYESSSCMGTIDGFVERTLSCEDFFPILPFLTKKEY